MPGLIIVPMDLEPGFRKADIHSLPAVSNAMVFNFFSQAAVESKQMYVCVECNNKLLNMIYTL